MGLGQAPAILLHLLAYLLETILQILSKKKFESNGPMNTPMMLARA